MALGTILREARERKGLSVAQVAESTRMLQQIVEDLEIENFRRIAAPLYGRSFIKLYAACVGVDPVPLVEEFNLLYSGNGAAANVKIRNEEPTVPRGYVPPKPVPKAERLPPPAPAETLPASPGQLPPAPALPPQSDQPAPLSAEPLADVDAPPPDDSVIIVDENPEDEDDLFAYGTKPKKQKSAARGTASPLPHEAPKNGLRRIARAVAPTRAKPAKSPAPIRPFLRDQTRRLRSTALRFWTGLDNWRQTWQRPQPPVWLVITGAGILAVFLILLVASLLMRGSNKPGGDVAPVSRYVLDPPEFYAD